MTPRGIWCMLLTAAAAASPPVSQLSAQLEQILHEGAVALNTSFSVAVHDFTTGQRTAVARGVNDRATGSPISVDSMFPVGSVTKTFITVSSLRC